MASWPTYDPNIWVGGISSKDYKSHHEQEAQLPEPVARLPGRVRAGVDVQGGRRCRPRCEAGYSLNASYPCPSSYSIGGTPKANYESQGYGTISMLRAIEVSCDTVFYKFAYETWLRMGGLHPKKKAKDPFTEMAKAFGLGKPTGLDLPAESDGRIADRAWKQAYWKATKDFYCAKAKTGYPEVAKTDPQRAAYLLQLSKENCADGYAYRGGDAANFAIGQGDTTVDAAADGPGLRRGRQRRHAGHAAHRQRDHVARRQAGAPDRARQPAGRIPVSKTTLDYMQRRAARVSPRSAPATDRSSGPASRSTRSRSRAKTGTGEVYGKQTTSWFASYAPANKPQYAVVMMVSQGGTGSGVSGPSVAEIYKTLFGVHGSTVELATASPPGGHPTTAAAAGAAGRHRGHAGEPAAAPPTGCRSRRPAEGLPA